MVEGCSHKAVVESSSLSISTVLVAQSGRAEDCGSLWHGFKSHLTPQYTHIAQLVRAGILYIQGQGFKSLCEYMNGLKIKRICKNCGKEFDALAIKVRQGKALFCCKECYNQYRKLNSYDPKERNRLYQKKAKYGLSEGEYKHLFIKQNNKCEKCGWGEVNPTTGLVPLQIHHIDGNALNNKASNLQLLCPNCHSLTENFGSRNRNANHDRLIYFGLNK